MQKINTLPNWNKSDAIALEKVGLQCKLYNQNSKFPTKSDAQKRQTVTRLKMEAI